jgi:hypothetical protein
MSASTNKNLPAALLGCLVTVTLLSGCGFGTAPHGKGDALLVTTGYGTHFVASASETKVESGENALTQLKAHFRVTSGPGGQRVVAINGITAGRGSVWSLFINGVSPTGTPKASGLSAGDSVWWDLHPTQAASTVPAVVGEFPDPFVTGESGQEFPTLLNCASNVTAACDRVAQELKKFGVKASDQAFGAGSGDDSLSVVIGSFSVLRGIIAAELLQAGPASSGVYARFVGRAGRVLELLNGYGNVVRTLRGNIGLVAATQQQELTAPVWLLTGTDLAGVNAAARAFNQRDLHDHYAVVIDNGKEIPIPVS